MRTFLSTFLSFIICHFLFFLCLLSYSPARAQVFVELNCENLFDTRHDEGKEDFEYMPEAGRRWTVSRYWRKLDNIGRELLSCSDSPPDLVALVEVENDSVLRDLTRRSLLRGAGYDFLMTSSPDVRGIDCALLYRPVSFRPLCYDCLSVEPLPGMRPTRDILYVMGETAGRDTLHIFVVHAPSRYGGERPTRPHRRQVVATLLAAMADVEGGKVIVAGDFNDYAYSPSLVMLGEAGLSNVSATARGANGLAGGTYRFQGKWESIDHILVSPSVLPMVRGVNINDAPFLLEQEPRYGGYRPRRTYQGFQYRRDGYSDHLPLVMRLGVKK